MGISFHLVMAERRIIKELKDCQSSGLCVSRLDSNIYRCIASILGPVQSPFEDGVFALSVKYPEEYPFKPIAVRFLTTVYHPNISEDGVISLDILSDMWSPALTLRPVLLSVSSILGDPNFQDALNINVAALYYSDREMCLDLMREGTKRFAM